VKTSTGLKLSTDSAYTCLSLISTIKNLGSCAKQHSQTRFEKLRTQLLPTFQTSSFEYMAAEEKKA